ncbi:MAG TPA: hypothetical protein VJ813_03505 [Vicinamibacterales bacterium]|nr:hypothetical protein [Vicinamibacterales bacterium]
MRKSALALGGAATLAVALLYAPWIAEPHIRYDDFNFLTKSRTWGETWTNLWLPMNEHVMPLSRLAAGLLMQLVPRQSAIPQAVQVQGVLAVVLGMWLLYAFVRRELGNPFYGVVAMTLWGVTSTYYECVTWYSASFFTLALDVMLAALLAAQWYRRSRRWYALAACAACCALAPAFHGTAILAGAWCALYLLYGQRDGSRVPSWWLRAAVAAVPLLGAVAFVAVSLTASAGRIVRAEHYRGKTIFAAFDPAEGIQNTLRTLADNQVPGAFGIWDRHSTFSWPFVLAIVAGVTVLGVIWWRATPRRRLLALGLALTVGSDLLAYSARADWNYERSVHNWTRYHLFPHLGLVLFAVGGLPRFDGRWFALAPAGGLSRRQGVALAALIATMFACHWPRTHRSHFTVPPEQIAVLERIERVDAHCRTAGIDGATARQALGFLQFPLGFDGDNAWEFLRCSPSPRPMPVDEARALLGSMR